jgi:hypothetical protein
LAVFSSNFSTIFLATLFRRNGVRFKSRETQAPPCVLSFLKIKARFRLGSSDDSASRAGSLAKVNSISFFWFLPRSVIDDKDFFEEGAVLFLSIP